MSSVQNIVGFLGRFCLSVIFIISGLVKFTNLQGGEIFLANGMCNLMGYTQSIEWLQKSIEFFLPMANVLLLIAAIVEVLCGVLILLGFLTRFGAFILLLYLIPVTLVFHHFWYLEGDEKNLQIIMFLKNLSIFGGLLLVLAYGKGFKANKPKNPDSSAK